MEEYGICNGILFIIVVFAILGIQQKNNKSTVYANVQAKSFLTIDMYDGMRIAFPIILCK